MMNIITWEFVHLLFSGHIDHSAILMRVITWNHSFKGISQAESAQDDFAKDELETHATILDKMLAWEKKLYDEVRVSFLHIFYLEFIGC